LLNCFGVDNGVKSWVANEEFKFMSSFVKFNFIDIYLGLINRGGAGATAGVSSLIYWIDCSMDIFLAKSGSLCRL
jgi:hypothetical protein